MFVSQEKLSRTLDLRQKLLNSHARVLFVVAHPDDEVIGAGGSLLSQFKQCEVVHVTDGAPADMVDAQRAGFGDRRDYAHARREEAAAALSLAGITKDQIIELGVTDQRASYELAGLACLLSRLFAEIRAEIVFTQPYEGGHPDHDSTAFAVHAARQLLTNENATTPQIVEMTSYHHRDDKTVYSEFLNNDGCAPQTFELSTAQRSMKRKMFECFVTQREVLQWFPIDVERFREAPDYDFTRTPHTGKLHYEYFDWGMTGDKWRRLAHEARVVLKTRGLYDAHDFECGVSAGAGRSGRGGRSRTDSELSRRGAGAGGPSVDSDRV
jgi:N-acetylglucosamine malate deacetylase 2